MDRHVRRRVGLIVALAALLCIAPACNATAGGHKWGSGQPSNSVVRQAFRPLFAPDRGHQFYLSGYAGAAYPSRRRAAAPAVYPSTYHQATGLGPWAVLPHPLRHHWYDPVKP